MARLIFTLSDEQRAKLKAYQNAAGLKSEADALRHMIDQTSPTGGQGRPVQGHPGLTEITPEEWIRRQQARIETRQPTVSTTTEGIAAAMTPGAVTFGPVTPAAGSRLKKPKAAK